MLSKKQLDIGFTVSFFLFTWAESIRLAKKRVRSFQTKMKTKSLSFERETLRDIGCDVFDMYVVGTK